MSEFTLKIAHLTSAHPRSDTRVFGKMCLSLVEDNHSVTLVIADGNGSTSSEGVELIDVGRPRNRIERMWLTTRRIFKTAITIDADIYHLHDPELLFVGVQLKKVGKTVVFDSHEDVSKQILSKYYIPKYCRHVVSLIYGLIEAWACKKFDGVICATKTIQKKFALITEKTVTINNYPLLTELVSSENDASGNNSIVYVGAISKARGVKQILESLLLVENEVTLDLAGGFENRQLHDELESSDEWNKVRYHGVVDRTELKNLLGQSTAGLVTFLPEPNHVDAQPNKIFEYMSAGIPVIGSNFPLWRELIEHNGCGICVDPTRPQEIADAIDYLIENPAKAAKMGAQGLVAVQNKFNWQTEFDALISFYRKLGSKL